MQQFNVGSAMNVLNNKLPLFILERLSASAYFSSVREISVVKQIAFNGVVGMRSLWTMLT